MIRTLILHGTLTLEGESVPECELTQRIPWPSEITLEEVVAQFGERLCRELHEPKLVWKIV